MLREFAKTPQCENPVLSSPSHACSIGLVHVVFSESLGVWWLDSDTYLLTVSHMSPIIPFKTRCTRNKSVHKVAPCPKATHISKTEAVNETPLTSLTPRGKVFNSGGLGEGSLSCGSCSQTSPAPRLGASVIALSKKHSKTDDFARFQKFGPIAALLGHLCAVSLWHTCISASDPSPQLFTQNTWRPIRRFSSASVIEPIHLRPTEREVADGTVALIPALSFFFNKYLHEKMLKCRISPPCHAPARCI